MIKDKIEYDVQDEIKTVQTLTVNFLNQSNNLDEAKKHINKFLLDEINTRSLIMVDTVINYLMDDIKTVLNGLDPKIQLAFYELNLPVVIKDSARNENHTKSLDIPDLVFSQDPRNNHALKTSVTPFLAGSGITAIAWIFDPTKKISLIVGGLATAAATAYIYKATYEKAEPMARKQIEYDVKEYLNIVEHQMTKWLLSVSDTFVEEFEIFCNKHSISFDKETNS